MSKTIKIAVDAMGGAGSPKKIIDSVASTIDISTLMSFITIPIVVFFALKYFY